MSPEQQPTPNTEMITRVPTAEELAANTQNIEAQESLTEDTLTREAFIAMGKGAVGSAAELNLQYPSQVEARPVTLPPLSEVALPEPYEEPESERRISGEELKALREQLKEQGKL